MNGPDRITREELYDRVWKLPATKLAKELGISNAALAKLCRALNVPKPGPGHWRLVQLGWEIERPALPPLDEHTAAAAAINPEPQPTREIQESPAPRGPPLARPSARRQMGRCQAGDSLRPEADPRLENRGRHE